MLSAADRSNPGSPPALSRASAIDAIDLGWRIPKSQSFTDVTLVP